MSVLVIGSQYRWKKKVIVFIFKLLSLKPLKGNGKKKHLSLKTKEILCYLTKLLRDLTKVLQDLSIPRPLGAPPSLNST